MGWYTYDKRRPTGRTADRLRDDASAPTKLFATEEEARHYQKEHGGGIERVFGKRPWKWTGR